MLYFFKNCSKTVIFETATYLLIFFCVIPSCCPRTFHYIEKIHCLTRELRVKFHAKTRDITCARVDMNFVFEWSTRYLTRSLRSLVRYRVQHESKKIHIHKRVCNILYLLYNHKNYNFLNCDWFKKLLFPTNSLAKLLSDSLLSDSLLLDSLLLDSSTNQSNS